MTLRDLGWPLPRYILTSTATRFYLDDSGTLTDNYLKDAEANKFVTTMFELPEVTAISEIRAASAE